MKNKLSFLSTTVVLAIAASGAIAQNARFDHILLGAGWNMIRAEVAASDAQRQQGLMFRQQMANNAGMVFVFDQPATQCMWMKNTLLPLSVAFIDAEGKIVNIEDMQPQTLDKHCSKKAAPVKYALEMNLGWFKKNDIKPGSIIAGLPPAK